MSTGDSVGKDRGERVVSTGPCPHAACAQHVYVLESVYDKLRDSGASFYCPMGHAQSFDGKKKRDEIAEAQRRAKAAEERLEAERRKADVAARTCPWPTCDGRVLASERGLRQHMGRRGRCRNCPLTRLVRC